MHSGGLEGGELGPSLGQQQLIGFKVWSNILPL